MYTFLYLFKIKTTNLNFIFNIAILFNSIKYKNQFNKEPKPQNNINDN